MISWYSEKLNPPKWTILKFNGGTSMDFLTNLDSETLKAELLAFLELGDDEFDISSMGEFEEQFVEFIKDDLSYAD